MPDRAEAATSSHRPRAFWVVMVGLSLLVALPAVLTKHLPIQDLPNHEAITATLARAGEPDFGDRFVARGASGPYTLLYGVTVPLSRLVGARVAVRGVLALSVIAIPLAFAALVLAWDRDHPWASLLGLTLVYQDGYQVGFLGYLLAFPLALAATALAVAGARRRTGLLAPMGVAILGVLLYLTHPIGFALAAIASAVLVAGVSGLSSRSAALLAGFLPGGALLVMWLVGSPHAARTRALPWLFDLEYLLRAPVVMLGDRLAAAVLLLALALCVVSYRDWIAPRLDGVLLVAIFLALFLALPFAVGGTVWFDLRIAPMVWVAIFLTFGASLTRRLIPRLLVVAIALVVLAGVWVRHHSFSRGASPLFDVFARLEDDRTLLPIVLGKTNWVEDPFYVRRGAIRFFALETHLVSYYHVEKKGLSPWMTFAPGLPWIPLEPRDPFFRASFGIAEPFFPAHLMRRLPALAGHFDYLLLVGGDDESIRRLRRYGPIAARAGDFTVFALAGDGSAQVP